MTPKDLNSTKELIDTVRKFIPMTTGQDTHFYKIVDSQYIDHGASTLPELQAIVNYHLRNSGREASNLFVSVCKQLRHVSNFVLVKTAVILFFKDDTATIVNDAAVAKEWETLYQLL